MVIGVCTIDLQVPESSSLKQKRQEREARRLRRQLELAEATDAVPPPPPPEMDPPMFKTRGRQMSNLI